MLGTLVAGFLDRDALDEHDPAAGNAAAHDGDDHVRLLELALARLPDQYVVVRVRRAWCLGPTMCWSLSELRSAHVGRQGVVNGWKDRVISHLFRANQAVCRQSGR
jgi:hypothetical protein